MSLVCVPVFLAYIPLHVIAKHWPLGNLNVQYAAGFTTELLIGCWKLHKHFPGQHIQPEK